MAERCSTESDFLMYEHDFTDEKTLQSLRDEDKLIVIYRKIRGNRYIKDCYIRSQLLSALNVESKSQLTLWGQGRYEQRFRKVGLLPAIDGRLKAEYITERSIRLLNLFDTFELVECDNIRVGSQSGGVGVIHGSEEIVCKLSPIELADEEEIEELNNRTNIYSLFEVCPEYTLKFVNINDKIYRRIIRVIPDFSLMPNLSLGLYIGEVNEVDGKIIPYGYGEFIAGEAYKNKNVDDTNRNRFEITCNNWEDRTPQEVLIDFVRQNDNMNFNISFNVFEDDELKTFDIYAFRCNVGSDKIIDSTSKMRSYPVSIVHRETIDTITWTKEIKIPMILNDIDELTNYHQEYFLKLFIFIYINTLDFDTKYDMLQQLSFYNFNLTDILNIMYYIKLFNQVELDKEKFTDDEFLEILSNWIDTDLYLQKFDDVLNVNYLPEGHLPLQASRLIRSPAMLEPLPDLPVLSRASTEVIDEEQLPPRRLNFDDDDILDARFRGSSNPFISIENGDNDEVIEPRRLSFDEDEEQDEENNFYYDAMNEDYFNREF